MTSIDKRNLRLRYFRSQDADKILQLFLLVSLYGPDSPRNVALQTNLTRPISCITYGISLAGLLLASQGFTRSFEHALFGAMLLCVAGIPFFGYRYLISQSYLNYYHATAKTDLADIASHYKLTPSGMGDELEPSGPSAFWVVEHEKPEGSGYEIIGTIALDCHTQDGVTYGELRRMAVSPYHRRMGVANILIQGLLDHARKHQLPYVVLNTTEHHHAAVNLYKKFGWNEQRRFIVKDMMGLDEDSLCSVRAMIKDGLRLRYFREKDTHEVQKLFLLAMAYGPDSPRDVALRMNLTQPTAYVTYGATMAGLLLSSLSISRSTRNVLLGATLSCVTTALFLGYRYLLSKSFMDYCNASVKADLSSIASHYKMVPSGNSDDLEPAGSSAFWVVEYEKPDGSGCEIVGTTALDCHTKDGVTFGELRRMVVSPYHRRMGIANMLIQGLIDHARNHRLPYIMLGTSQYQMPAMHLYRKFGWVEQRRFPLRDEFGIVKVDAVEFKLDLTEKH